jgi:hypothetical protein
VVGALAAYAGDLLSIIGVVIGLGLVTGWVAAPLAWWQFRGRPDLGGAETTLTLDEGGTHFDSPFMHGGEPWSSYRRVHDIGGCFLFDNMAGGITVVPKRAFSPDQLRSVYRLLDRHGLLAGGATA